MDCELPYWPRHWLQQRQLYRFLQKCKQSMETAVEQPETGRQQPAAQGPANNNSRLLGKEDAVTSYYCTFFYYVT